MGRRGKADPRGVKFVTCVPEGELKRSKIVKSLLVKMRRDEGYEFVFCVDGELVSRRYRQIMVQNSDIARYVPYNQLVAIHRNDGTSELGLVGFDYKDIVLRKELTSIYVHKIWNSNTGKWEWPGTLYDRAPYDRLGKMFPFYNENLDRAIDEQNETNVRYPFGTMQEYKNIYALTHYENDWVTKCPQGIFPQIDMDGMEKFLATKRMFSRPPDGYTKWADFPPQFYTFKKSHYLKSVYRDVISVALRRELFALDDLMMVNLMDIDSCYPKTRTIWTSLDETLKGNV